MSLDAGYPAASLRERLYVDDDMRGLLIYTGSGINRLPDPFTGPYAASKAAGDVLAEVMAFEVARYGIETVIVQPGAYTSGTDHFKHAIRPVHGEIVAQYDRLAGLSDELAVRLDNTNLPGRRHDAGEVAEAIRDIVAMAPGTRPRRIDIDPQGREVARINEITATLQRNYFERVIRNEREMNAIRQYILDNPLLWALDEENPLREIQK